MGWIGDHQWESWLIAAAVLACLELVSMDFVLIMLAGGAVVGAILAIVGLPALIAIAGALVTAVALLAILRPNIVHRIHSGPSLRTGIDALIGTRAHVLSPVSARPGGRVKIGGEEWSALAFDESDRFVPGDVVDVVEIRGATAYVLRTASLGGSMPELPTEETGE